MLNMKKSLIYVKRHCKWHIAFLFLLCVILYFSSRLYVPISAQSAESILISKQNEKNVENFDIQFSAATLTLFQWCSRFDLNFFLLDKRLLTCIDLYDSNVKGCTGDESSIDWIYLGFFEESRNQLDKLAKRPPNSKWIVYKMNGHYAFVNEESHVAFVRIDKRPNYWFVNELPETNLSAFAFLKPKETRTVSINNHFKVLVPANVKFLLRQLEMSKFIACNETIAKSLRRKNPYMFKTPALITQKNFDDFVYLRDLMHKLNIFPLLFGGTALGWYRECGLITYTSDLDFAIKASEYNEDLEKKLKRDLRLKLYWILGTANDSLELSVYSGEMKIDVFALYETEIGSWVGGLRVNQKQKLKWNYPKLNKICSAVLKDQLFHVPCEIEKFLIADYGQMWHKPQMESNFTWYKSHNNVEVAGVWSREQWPSVYRTFWRVHAQIVTYAH